MKLFSLISIIVVLGVLVFVGWNSMSRGSQQDDDIIRLEGMMPKEDNQTIDAMTKKEDTDTTIKNDEVAVPASADENAMKKDNASSSPGQYTTYSPDAVQLALSEGKRVILFFYATWCPTCKAADEVFSKTTPPANLVIFKTDYDTYTELKQRYGITYQHTFVALNVDGSMRTKISGAMSFSELENL